MAHLMDTNCLMRSVRPDDPEYALVTAAIECLHRSGEIVYITAQNLIEFWNVATRPVDRNGLGFTPVQAEELLAELETLFPRLPDTPDIYPAWRRIVASVGVSGVQVHDARLVAVMQVHQLTRILTLNTRDFVRYPGITVVHPQDVVGTPPADPTPP